MKTLTSESAAPDTVLMVTALRSQHPAELVAVPLAPIYLHWQAEVQGGPEAGDRGGSSPLGQLGYQLAYGPAAAVWEADWTVEPETEGPTAAGVLAPGGPLAGRERRGYRVRLRSQLGWSDWSALLVLEGGLAPGQWSATLVTASSKVDEPTPMLRREFDLPVAPRRSLLHITALGWHESWINGRRVAEDLFTPEWTSYNNRLTTATYDVTGLLRAGRNAIGVFLGDGWYRTRLAWGAVGRTEQYGSELGLLAQLEIDLPDGGSLTVGTDGEWRAGFGQVRQGSLYDGATLDLGMTGPEFSEAGFDDSTWEAAAELQPGGRPFDRTTLEPRGCPPIRQYAVLPASLSAIDGGVRADLGQNMAGWLRVTVDGRAGQRIVVQHAEAVERDGRLFRRALRTATSVDTYVLGHDGRTELEPRFTYHGFQYADILTEAEVVAATGVAISSAMGGFGTFECSSGLLSKLARNIEWTFRSNAIAVPTDSCQRDERLGWTGDAQLCSPAFGTVLDAEAFYRSWLVDLALEQGDEGPGSVVPNVLRGEDMPMGTTHMNPWGRSAWADAATVVPWVVWNQYGSLEVLHDQLDSMRRWVATLQHRAGEDGLIHDDSLQWGDWVDPDAPPDQPWLSKVPPIFVVNAYFARSARLLAQAEDLVGDADEAGRYRALHAAVGRAAWQAWGVEAGDTQTGAALALEFDLVPAAERVAVGERLAAAVRAGEGRIATGSVGSAVVLHALARSGHIDEAYQMLLRTASPSWLYQVAMGASTVWERWDAVDRDGVIRSFDMDTTEGDVMVSLNQPMFGAVLDWVYQYVAGLGRAAPGYSAVRLQPRPAVAVTSAKAALATRHGRLAIDWYLDDDGSLVADVDLPFGVTGLLDLPVDDGSAVTVDGQRAQSPGIGSGRHRITVTRPVVAGAGSVAEEDR